jgi:hypothetical protein
MYNLHEQDAKVEEVSTSADWLGPNLEEWGGLHDKPINMQP